jgi:hypothetical protein
MAKSRKLLRWALLAITAIVILVVAVEAFKLYSFTHDGNHTSNDVAEIRAEAKKIGGVVLPPSASVDKAEMHVDPQGGKDLSIVAKIPDQDVDKFITESNIQPWITGQIDKQTGSLNCVLISDDWPGHVVSSKDGWKCLTDHGFNGYNGRTIALRAQNDGTTLVLIKLVNP